MRSFYSKENDNNINNNNKEGAHRSGNIVFIADFLKMDHNSTLRTVSAHENHIGGTSPGP